MFRLLTRLILSALFLGQAFSVAGAVCQHGSARDHALARESRDGAVAATAQAEETAASVVAKKGALSGGIASVATAILASIPLVNLPPKESERLDWLTTDGPFLARLDTGPLLRPPHA